MNRSFIYWKWDADVLDPEILTGKVLDLTHRTQMTNIFIGMEWIREDFYSKGIGDAFRRSIAMLHDAGRKVMIECCVRGEGAGFYREHPDEPSYLLGAYESRVGENGLIRLPHEQVWHYWRHTGDNGEHRVFAVYRMLKIGDHAYAYVEPVEDFTSEVRKTDHGYEVCIHTADVAPNETLVAIVGFAQPIPDLSHPELIAYFRKMVRHAAELGADGVFSDEWGYDVILDIREENPYDDKDLAIRHLPYSRHMDRLYREQYGESLFHTLIDLFYAGKPHRSILVDRYIRLIRQICTKNEDRMYSVVKEEMGPDAFWGVHPTWWGSRDEQNLEFFKNGFDWWDAKRDYAQTDEAVILPIRTALAHRFRSPLWYNMWYSMGTRDIRTYYAEAWRNLRFGGRTHYLGYECPNERVVLELKSDGLLESVEQMDSRIRLFDDVLVQPDCKLLLLFGYEAVSNWDRLGAAPPWTPVNPRLQRVLQTADALFNHILCDLVPSYAAENGSLYVNSHGKPQYGNQIYDAVIAMYPTGMSEEATAFLRAVNPNALILCGVSDDPFHAAARFADIPAAETLLAALSHLDLKCNRTENGCVLHDGSMIFTGNGVLPIGNDLQINTQIQGHSVQFNGKDALWVDVRKRSAIFPEGKLWIDGRSVESMR